MSADMPTIKYVTNATDILKSFHEFNRIIGDWYFSHKLLVHTQYWVYEETSGNFAASKFVGFKNMDAKTYELASLGHGHYYGDPHDGKRTRLAIQKVLGKEYVGNRSLNQKLVEWDRRVVGNGVFDNVNQDKWKFITITDISQKYGSIIQKEKQNLGQGFSTNSNELREIEKLAVHKAEKHFISQGFEVERKGKPYDLHCIKKNQVVYVEVKGTTGPCEKIILTEGEISFSKKHYNNMALFILYNVNIISINGRLCATGGKQKVFLPWKINYKSLKPISYFYDL